MQYRGTTTGALIAVLCVGAVGLSQIVGDPASRPSGNLSNPPDEPAVVRAERIIRSLFKDEYGQRDAATRANFARKLIQQGLETNDDPAVRFVLFRDARDIAASVGNASLAVEAIDQLAAVFNVPAIEMKLAALSAAAKAADMEKAAGVATCAMRAADQAISMDEYDPATRLLTLAEACATRAKQMPLLAAAKDKFRELRATQAEFEKARAAMELLGREPDNIAAKSTVGRFLCLTKGDWARGLPLLAGGDDLTLKALAQRETPPPEDARSQMQLASDWWELAEKFSELSRTITRNHAAVYYRRALPQLSGMSRTIAEKRIEEVDAIHIRSLQLERGLRAELFDGAHFNTLVQTRVDSQINFDWGQTSPAEKLPKDNFSIRWTGRLRITSPGSYTLICQANAGAKLIIDGNAIINNPNLWRKRNGERITIELAEGFHTLRLEYWDTGGEANMKLLWQPPGAKEESPIPDGSLYHSTSDGL